MCRLMALDDVPSTQPCKRVPGVCAAVPTYIPTIGGLPFIQTASAVVSRHDVDFAYSQLKLLNFIPPEAIKFPRVIMQVCMVHSSLGTTMGWVHPHPRVHQVMHL